MIAWIAGALLAAVTSFVILAAIFVPLERVFPARRGQRILRPELALDACFFLGQYLVFTAVAFAATALLGEALEGVIPSAMRAWMRERSAWIHVFVAVVLGDLTVYWFHRACHRYDFLWRFHAVHHSTEHLDWLAAHREHPVDGIATQLLMNLPAVMLGVRVELLAGVALFRGVWAIFVHSNVRLPLGPLRWILGAPELHHWHHAKVRRTAHNFANLAPWIDWLFGTHHCPEGEERYALGMDSDRATPRARAPVARYAGMLAWPFVRRR